MDDKTGKILEIFEQINKIPRCSKKEEEISRWLIQWAETKQFPVKADRAGNLCITVAPSPGYERAPIVVIQGHMDMVCEKSAESGHDFSRDPIRLVFDGDWLRAENTTLGADNGIAIALALALAEDESVVHPPLELLFTVDEETGLNGAKLLEPGFVEGKVLLNVDSETEGVFTVGCAGGRNTNISRKMVFTALGGGSRIFDLSIGGLCGGHSGVDIIKQRAGANKILARALHQLCSACDIRLVSIKGGSTHNAISRDAAAVFACDPAESERLAEIIAAFERSVKIEYEAIEASLAISLSPADLIAEEKTALSVQETTALINLILALPHGVMGMSALLEDLVETSNNLAIIEIRDNTLHIVTSQRSSVMSRMDEITASINAVAALAGAETTIDREFAPWTPDMQSTLLKRCQEVYLQVSGKKAIVKSIHAGLECAIIGDKYPGMDMISFGPTLEDAHSPNERLFIPSVGEIRDFMVALLASYGSK